MADVPDGGSFDSLPDFVSIAKGVIATGQDLDEANTKAKIVTPLIRTLGWRVYDNDEVILEYSGKNDFNDRVDYVMFGSDDVYAVVEAKQIGRNINNDSSQIRRYMRLFGADWGLLTNGEQYLIYQSNGESEETQVESMSLQNLSSSTYIQSLSRQSAYSEQKGTSTVDEEVPRITEESKEKFEKLVNKKRSDKEQSRQSDTYGPLYESLIESVAPSVEGYEEEKLGILLSLVSGVKKSTPNGRSIRGATHVLFVHDPGTLTGALIEAAVEMSPEGVYLSGEQDGEELMTAETDSRRPSASELSEYSMNTLANASHAIVTEFGEVNRNKLKNMQEAFTAEIPSDSYTSTNEVKNSVGLLAASKPMYGRFDEYEPIAEQIDIEPGLLPHFDLIFLITDHLNKHQDRREAEQVIQTNYASEVLSQQKENSSVENAENGVVDQVSPDIDSEFLRKYITYAKYNVFPRMSEDAKQILEDFYVEKREQGAEEDAPVPITVKKLEGLIRLAEASARLRLSDTVEPEDANRATELADYCLREMGLDPEIGELDADVVETGTSKSQRNRIKNIKELIASIAKEYDEGAPLEVVIERAEEEGMDPSKAENEINKLKQKGEVYEMVKDHLRTT